MTQPTVWLLDKNVVRRAIEGISAVLASEPLTTERRFALRVWFRGTQTHIRMLITPETANILSRRSHLLAVRVFLREVDVMQRGRYFLRWARRLREHGFTREDALVLSYGTFGRHPIGLGVTAVVTFDRPFINNFENHRQTLARRLRFMAAQLREPYNIATLPEMASPQQVLQAHRT